LDKLAPVGTLESTGALHRENEKVKHPIRRKQKNGISMEFYSKFASVALKINGRKHTWKEVVQNIFKKKGKLPQEPTIYLNTNKSQ
jgi:hypothetical protein